MDTLNTLLLGWLFSAVLILILVKFLYDKFLRGSDDEDIYSEAGGVQSESHEGISAEQTAAEKSEALARQKREARREATIVPSPSSLPKGSAGPAAGQDADAVRWINTIMQWMFRGPHKAISAPYLALLNDMTAQTALETGVLIEVLEMLPATPSPQLRNVVVDCTPDDNMHLTCDCETMMFLRLQTTRTHREVTTESEYAAAVCPLIGRVNASVRTHQCTATLKFDGWPEVEIELEGIRNNEVGLGEKELQEVIKEVVASAIRSMVLELDLRQDSSFPRFKRARELPDRVMPVGYDSMVRERMTHPPVLKSRAPVKPRDIPSVSLKDSRYEREPLLERPTVSAAAVPTTSNVLTQNVSAGLTASEERLIARNLSDYDKKEDHCTDPIDYGRRLEGTDMMWDRGYIPANFLEQVKAVTMAKIEEKAMAEPRQDQPFQMVGSNRQKLLDESKSSPTPPPDFDYIPYDSEYEEDEDIDDYLEKSAPIQGKDSRTGGSKAAPVVKSDEVFIPTESDVKSMVTKVADLFSPKSPVAISPSKGVEALPQTATPLGAMGLPHHPKSHFSPSLSAPLPPPAPTGVLNGKRLLVKIVKATGIGSDKSAVDGYVVVEMDEPNQKFTTATVKGSNSPFWDEQFLFDLSDITLELLFELYDESDSSFLGLGIVGIEELVATPSQRQIIPLQSRPYENDAVSGSLTVEFLFLDSTDLPDLTVRCSNIQQDRSPRGEGLVTTVTTTYAKAPLAADVAVNGTDSVAASALRDIERSTGTAPNAKSTIIIHASKKPEDEVMEEEEDDDENYVVNTLQYPFPGSTTGTTSPTTTTTPYSKPATISQVTTAPADIRDEGIDLEEDERGRGRTKRKRDSFFGTLKKRFSRSKVRSQSVEPTSPQAARETTPGNDMPRTATVGRSVSMERSTRLRPTGLLSVPKLDNRGEIGGRSGGDTGSTRSSVSETSGLSSSSTRTYVNEASMLIVETVENGLVKHYLVPVSLQQRNRWKKRGTKLHVFSGHTFVAKHLSRSLSCAVCEKSFPRRPGKQGYECRDCGLNTHKPCHVRTEVQCPNSKVNNMDLEYITDPREERRNLRNNQRP